MILIWSMTSDILMVTPMDRLKRVYSGNWFTPEDEALPCEMCSNAADVQFIAVFRQSIGWVLAIKRKKCTMKGYKITLVGQGSESTECRILSPFEMWHFNKPANSMQNPCVCPKLCHSFHPYSRLIFVGIGFFSITHSNVSWNFPAFVDLSEGAVGFHPLAAWRCIGVFPTPHFNGSKWLPLEGV